MRNSSSAAIRSNTNSSLYKNRNTPYFGVDPDVNGNYSSKLGEDLEPSEHSILQEEWIAISYNLSDEDREFLLRGARELAQRNILLRNIRASESRPLLYQDSPRKTSLSEFIQKEWVQKGWNPPDIERKVIEQYDPKLLKAVADYENKRGQTLPAELRFRKIRNRVSQAEIAGSEHAQIAEPSPSI